MDFLYQARNLSGAPVSGTIDAPSEDQAIFSLHQKNLIIISLEPAKKSLFESDVFSFLNKPGKKDVIIFTRQLATLVESDVPLLEAVNILYSQTEKVSFKKTISSMMGNIEGGAALSASLAEHKSIFDPFFTSMVKVGEVSGKLQETLTYLADHLERSASLNSKIRSALFYPIFVLTALIIVGIIMMTTVIPQLLTIIKDSGVTDLPLPTKILIATANFFNSYSIPAFIAIIIFVGAVSYYIKTDYGRVLFDKVKIKLPKFGRIIKNFYIARMAETLSTLIHAGVPILDAVEITSSVVGNEVYKSILLEAKKNIQGGGTLSATIQNYREFPNLVSSMVSTGERTGRTDFMLQHVLKFYQTEAENEVQNISQLIEPLLILLLGIGIGGLVAAVLLPIYGLINAS